MARLPTVASLFNSGTYVFGKEWKHLTSIIVLLMLPIYLISTGLEANPSLFLPYIFLSLIIGVLISIFMTGITYYRYEKDKTIHSGGLHTYIHEKFFSVLWVTILTTILVMLAMVLLAIPAAILGIIYAIAKPAFFTVGSFATGGTLSTFGLISSVIMTISAIIVSVGASVYMMFSVPIAVLTKKTGLSAINESIKLVKGRWWNIFGRMFLLQIFALLFIFIVMLLGAVIVGEGPLGLLITALLQQVAILPISIAYIIFYLDIRSNPRARDKAPKEVVKAKQVTVRKTAKKATKKKAAKKATKKSSKKTANTKRGMKKKTTKGKR